MSVLALHEPADRGPAPRILADVEARLVRFDDAARRGRTLDDDEAVHDLRVAARRLEAAIDLWRGALRRRPARRARRLLRRLRRSAGPVRELEVNAHLLAERATVAPPSERAALAEVLAGLREGVVTGRRELANRLTIQRMRRVRRRVERALDGIEKRLPAPQPFAGARERLAARRQAALDALLAAVQTLDDAQLHAARIAVKKWRYAEESLAAAGDALNASSPVLRALQRSLGAVHDRAALRDLLIEQAARRTEQGRASQAAELAPTIASLEAERLAEAMRLRDRAGSLPSSTG